MNQTLISNYLYLIVTLLIMTSPFLFCQEHTRIIVKNGIFCDVDSLPVFSFDSINNTINYYSDTIEKVSDDVQFIGGSKALSAYCDSIYCIRLGSDFDELNAQAFYSILFDANLKILEIRILKRLGYNNSKYKYDSLVKKILFSTEGKWIKSSKNNSNKYFYFGYFRLI